MRRPSGRTIVLAACVLGLAIAVAAGLFRRDIDAGTAATIAERMLVQYRTVSGEPARHFPIREGRQWADGWEFRWRYRPCPDLASLRIWISRNGERATFAEVPDCSGTGPGAARPVVA